MKVSIVTISFNQSKFLNDCILSVISQKHDNLEYIIVDSCSTDGSHDLIQRHFTHFNKVIIERDKGPADGLNKGFSYATGDIYGFLNSDDLLLPGTINKICNYFNKYPDIDVIYSNSTVIDSNGKLIRKFYSDQFSLKSACHGASIISQPSTFFRSSVFKKVGGFNVENKISWDGELFIDFGISGAKFKYINDFWSSYRLHDQSITGSASMSDSFMIYQNAIFKKVYKREKKIYDKIYGLVLKLFRKVKNPLDTWERLRKGPMYGVYKK